MCQAFHHQMVYFTVLRCKNPLAGGKGAGCPTPQEPHPTLGPSGLSSPVHHSKILPLSASSTSYRLATPLNIMELIRITMRIHELLNGIFPFWGWGSSCTNLLITLEVSTNSYEIFLRDGTSHQQQAVLILVQIRADNHPNPRPQKHTPPHFCVNLPNLVVLRCQRV